jgi:DNA-binding transcriptional LysR family regulator
VDIRPLQYFVTVASLKSFTRAGEQLHVTQPTISKMIRSLENELGVVLLDRSTKHVRLTDAGEAVLAQAQQIITALEGLTDNLSDVIHLRKGTARIGMPPIVGAHFFPAVIARFKAQYPEITLRLTEDGAKKIEEDVAEGRLDLGVTALPTDEERFETYPFVQEVLKVVLKAGHPLAERPALSLRDLREEPFILYRQDFALHDRIKRACAAAGFEPSVVCESSQWDFIREMVAANLGIALLPETICRGLDPARLASVPLVEPVIPWHLAVIWRKDRYLSFAARAWLKLVRTELGQ